MKADKFMRVPVDQLTAIPEGGVWRILADRYWVITAENEALFYRDSWDFPQCNANETLAESFHANLTKLFPGSRVEFIPRVVRFTNSRISEIDHAIEQLEMEKQLMELVLAEFESKVCPDCHGEGHIMKLIPGCERDGPRRHNCETCNSTGLPIADPNQPNGEG